MHRPQFNSSSSPVHDICLCVDGQCVHCVTVRLVVELNTGVADIVKRLSRESAAYRQQPFPSNKVSVSMSNLDCLSDKIIKCWPGAFETVEQYIACKNKEYNKLMMTLTMSL